MGNSATMQDVIQSFHPVQDGKTYVVFINGAQVRTVSGKSSWRTIGAAKNAVNNHLGSWPCYNYCRAQGLSASELREELEQSNILTYKLLN